MWFSTGIGWLDAAEAWFIEYVIGHVAAVLVGAVLNYAMFWLPLFGLYALWVWWREGADGLRAIGLMEPKGSSYPPLRARLAYRWRVALARLR